MHQVCQVCHFHLRNIGKIRSFIDKDTAHMLVHAFIISRLDYCNALLAGLPAKATEPLQKIQNKAARIVVRKGIEEESRQILQDLHWLPITRRVEFKIVCIAYKCLNDSAPLYLRELIEPYQPSRVLRSSNSGLLKCPLVSTCFEERAFSSAGPRIWNSLHECTRKCVSFPSFKKSLKFELFRRSV